jgi:hypothetical protein
MTKSPRCRSVAAVSFLWRMATWIGPCSGVALTERGEASSRFADRRGRKWGRRTAGGD